MKYKCDCCGEKIDAKDFDKGATHDQIDERHSDTICIECNSEVNYET